MPFVAGFLLVFGVFVGAMRVWEWRNGNGVGLVTRQTRWAGHCLLYQDLYYRIFLHFFSVSFSYLCTSTGNLFLNFSSCQRLAEVERFDLQAQDALGITWNIRFSILR
jgi:hypothetical protein